MDNDNRNWLMRRALHASPNEVCGFILKDGSIVEIPNASHSPQTMFAMSRRHLCERVPNPDVIEAIWHTHPKGSIRPSKGDIDAMFTGAICPAWKYYIVTKDNIAEVDVKSHTPQQNSFWSGFLLSGTASR